MNKMLAILMLFFYVPSVLANTHMGHMRAFTESSFYNINIGAESKVGSEIYYCVDTGKFYFPTDCIGVMQVPLDEIFRRFDNDTFK